jgi:hypothetical protein
MLEESQIKSFQKCYKKCFGEKISKEEAYEKGIQLIRVMQLIYQPITKGVRQEPKSS